MKNKKHHGMTLKSRDALFGMLFLAPWLIGFIAFTAYPIIYSFWMSICHMEFAVTGLESTYVGFKWYIEILNDSAEFIPAILDTTKFIAFSTPMILVAAIILALLLNSITRGRTFFRALFFFPVMVVSGPIMSRLIGNNATAMIKPEEYAVYDIIREFPKVVSVPLLYIFDNIVIFLWYSGVQILIILIGLQKVSASLYEAADMDGASSWQKFWKITFPMMRPMILLSGIYTIVQLANLSDNRIVVLINENLTRIQSPYSYSAALSWLYAIIVLILLFIAFLLLKERREKYEAK